MPGHIVLPKEISGVDAKIIVLLGDRFPMIGAHKVLPAYAALIEQLVTGRFDPFNQKAVWPSTGNYCRGGVAVSRILGCRGVAVLPEGMSRERFEWLEKWVTDPGDIIRTPGTESNVKEIYDKCAELSRDDSNVILNQFSSFSNYLIHYECTGRAAEDAFKAFNQDDNHELAAFVSATGSSGTIAAGDFLKRRWGSKVVAVEALECPTMLNNGLWRAQHSGDRRQAHSAHSQCHEPRLRRRGLGPNHGPAQPAVRFESGPGLSRDAPRSRTRAGARL
ncbi:pyridoxal-phosphate dependent enzyme [Bradyrhizobium sp. JR3.5]